MNDELLSTPQEHNIIGSSVEDHYYNTPYTPIAILKNIISIEEYKDRRKEKRKLPMGFYFTVYYGLPPSDCILSLEDLNINPSSHTYGQTLRDPILLWYDKDQARKFEKRKYTISKTLPFQRNEPVVRLENE